MNESIWIAVAIIVLIVSVVIWVAMVARKQAGKARARLKNSMEATARASGLTIERTEFFRNRIIGLTGHERTLVYVSQNGEQYHSSVTPLDEISYCEIVSLGNKRTIRERSGKQKVEEHINSIVLNLYQNKQLRDSLVFYNEIADGSMELAENRDKAHAWKALIESSK